MSMLLFFFNDTATTEIYTLFLHDALPIWSFRCCSSTIRNMALLMIMSAFRLDVLRVIDLEMNKVIPFNVKSRNMVPEILLIIL